MHGAGIRTLLVQSELREEPTISDEKKNIHKKMASKTVLKVNHVLLRVFTRFLHQRLNLGKI